MLKYKLPIFDTITILITLIRKLIKMNVGTKIDKLMKQNNVTQEILASNLGVTQKAIHDIVTGKTKKLIF